MTARQDFDIREALSRVLDNPPPGGVIAWHGEWIDWAQVCAFAHNLTRIIAEGGFPPLSSVALVTRNRPAHVAAMAAQAASGRPTAMVYAAQRPAGIARDLLQIDAAVILAAPEDWTEDALEAARQCGSLCLAIGGGAPLDISHVPDTIPRPDKTFRKIDPEVGFEILSSGTTGAPKRVPLRWETVSAATADSRSAYAGSSDGAPQIMLHPIGNIAGISYLLPVFAFGRKVVLLEKFDPDAWVDVIREFRPSRSSLPAAGVRMLLERDIAPDALSSLSMIVVGGSKIDEETRSAFEDRFGIPVLTAYGATEFSGVIANWSLDAWRQWGEAKRGSCGRASANVTLRVVDQESFEALPADSIGLLEARVDRLGPEWIRTNDLASIDEDGFLFIHGRADGAINRGGFKIVPETVAAAITRHPAVSEAVVIARPDARLGEVPVAAVELSPGASISGEDIREWLKDQLLAYQVPVEVRVMPQLPRNTSMKVALGEVKAALAEPETKA
jgi:acyl-coenzyme A synthetase/AMP-(fatty) acid ligase